MAPLAARLASAALPCSGDAVGRSVGVRPFEVRKNIDGILTSHLVSISKSAKDLVVALQANNAVLSHRVAVTALALCAQHALANSSVAAATEGLLVVAPRAAAVISELTGTLLTKVLAASSTDMCLTMAYFADVPTQVGFQAFQASVAGAKKVWARLHALARAGLAAALVWGERPFAAECERLALHAGWWTRLASLSIPFDRRFFEQDPAAAVHALLPAVLQATHFDLAVPMELAGAFGISSDAVLLAAIKGRLAADLSSRNSDAIEHCRRRVANSEALARFLLADCLVPTDGRDYERLRRIFATVLACDGAADASTQLTCRNGLLLLDVLDTYCGTARTRLPLHPLISGDPWSVLRDEVTLDAVPQLLSMASIVGVPADDICLLALEKHVASVPAGALLFVNATPILARIASKKSAIMAAKMFAEKADSAPERIAALTRAVDLAQAWLQDEDASTDDDLKQRIIATHERLKAACDAAATLHDLQRAGADEPAIRAHVGAPADLIPALLERFATDRSFRGGVSALLELTDTIAVRYGLVAAKIRSRVLRAWLAADVVSTQPAGAASGISLSGLLDDAPQTGPCPWAWDAPLQRAVAVLRGEAPDVVVAHLVRCVAGEAFPPGMWRSRLRSVLALAAVTGPTAAAEALQVDLHSLREHVLGLLFACRCQELALPQGCDDIVASNKEGLVRGLWRAHSHRAAAVRTAAELCLAYGVDDRLLWTQILQGLLANDDQLFLSRIFPLICWQPQLISLDILLKFTPPIS